LVFYVLFFRARYYLRDTNLCLTNFRSIFRRFQQYSKVAQFKQGYLLILLALLGNILKGQETEVNFPGEKENLGKNVNTKYIDTHPLISSDGQTLYFVRQNYPGNIRGRSDDQDIYYSNLKNGKWSLANNFGSPINDKYPNGVFSVSPDKNTMLLINSYNKDGTVKAGASISHKTKNGWSKPEAIRIKDMWNYSTYVDFYLSSNRNALIVAAEFPGSRGDQDLYVCFRSIDGKGWGKPINLGAVINSKKAEFSPFLAADSKTLFFASEGHGGFGKSDIYYSKRKDDTWKEWTPPINMGKKINTEDFDAYFTVSAKGEYAYFVSNEGSIEDSKDIFRIALPDEFKPEPILLVSGRVYNAKTRKPIQADIHFQNLITQDEEGIALSNPKSGKYQIALPRGIRYGYRAHAQGFLAIEENIDLQSITQYGEYQKNLYLMPVEAGQSKVLNNVFFEYETAEILLESYPELNRIAEFLAENPKIVVEIDGHTSNRGKAEKNLKLSWKRGLAIVEYLKSQGIEATRMIPRGFGSKRPRAQSRILTPIGQELNERIEMRIMNLE